MWRDAEHYDGPLDAVHAVAFPYSFPIVCGLRLAHRRGVPFYLTPFLHLGDPSDPNDRTRQQYTKPHLRWLLQQADGVFVQTLLERAAAIELGVDERRVVLQGLGVDPEECTGGDRDGLRARIGATSGEVVVGHLANNSVEKGTCDLLKAAERLWNEGKLFRVVLAGPEMKNFQTFWDAYPAKEKVTRLGVLNEREKRDFFAAIDLFALPSRTDSFGLVLLEAWANRKANLVYRAGGPAELVRDGNDGLQANCGDVEQLSSRLALLIGDSVFRLKLGENGFSRIGEEFQWEDKLAMVRTVLASKRFPTGLVELRASQHSNSLILAK
jgi:glycosyltransferase involved in cell wall biosynthesis